MNLRERAIREHADAAVAKRGRPFKGLKKVTFKLPPQLAEKLTRASQQLEQNKSEICTQALTQWLIHFK